jgi:hypothetical protein
VTEVELPPGGIISQRKGREVAFADGLWQMPTNPKLPSAKKIQDL